MLVLVIGESIGQRGRGGGGGGRRLRNRQRQGRLLASQSPLGPPPQPDVLSADPIPFDIETFQQAAPPQPIVPQRQGRQQQLRAGQLRAGRQFNIAGDGSTIQGKFPDAEGNYNFQ